MRIDGSLASYSLDRSTRPGAAVSPLRDVQRTDEARREQPSNSSASQGFERVAQPRQVEQGYLSAQEYQRQADRPTASEDPFGRALSNKAAQALASYGSTASMGVSPNASEVLGLDLFA